jgi:hypothetical protein
VNDEKNSFSKLAKLCNISTNDLQNVISMDGDNLILVCSLNGSNSTKQIICTMIVLLSCNVLFSEKWIPSTKILRVIKKFGILDVGGNFAVNMKKKSNLILKQQGFPEYMLISPDGVEVAKNLLKKLSNSESVTKNDLNVN